MKNQKFYNLLPIETLDSVALKTFGENPSSDLEQILKYLPQKAKILEIGGGTGRIGIELIKNGFYYTGIDEQPNYLEAFKQKLGKIQFDPKDTKLLNIAFEKLPENENFDAILFTWTVIGDFSKSEQLEALEKTYKILNKSGICLIDNPSKNQQYNEAEFYCPTHFYYADWKTVFDQLGFSHQAIIYQTKTGIERELIILTK